MSDNDVKKYIRSNPFPSYDEMIKRIGNNMEVYAEYGMVNHNSLKKIYESFMDEKIAKQEGMKLYNRGGTQALQMNCTAFMYFGPFSTSHNSDIKFAGKTLEFAWDGIGDFRV